MATGEKLLHTERVNVKLTPGIDRVEAEDVLRDVPGLRAVVQLFPDEHDQEMLGMYILDVAAEAVDAAIERLSDNPNVEFAHPTASRRLIR